jgi:antitoxin component YwqK of YwqJK toxin-antitoxin module
MNRIFLATVVLILNIVSAAEAYVDENHRPVFCNIENRLLICTDYNFKPITGMVYIMQGNMVLFKANFKDGKQNGLTKAYHENGQLQVVGNFKDGKDDGVTKVYYENGHLWMEINYNDGKKEGLEKWYYENGQLKVMDNYKNGRLDGLAKFYDETGKLLREDRFENGILIERREF